MRSRTVSTFIAVAAATTGLAYATPSSAAPAGNRCVHPVTLHLNSRGKASGDVKKFVVHTTDVFVKNPRYDVIGDIGVNSSKHGARIISFFGTNSRGKHWTGTREHADLWYYEGQSKRHHTYITSATAHGCFG